MTLLRQEFAEFGTTLLTFENAGDVLSMHRHVYPSDDHISIVLSGRLRIHGPGIGEFERASFAVFYPGLEHEFVALEDNTRVLQVTRKRDG